MKKNIVLLLLPLFLLAGCAGMGVMETSNPHTKLSDARHLYSKSGRPLIAERLIFEAIEIFKDQEDADGLGLAYAEYADFLRSDATVNKFNHFYKEVGFSDPDLGLSDRSITYDERFIKAKEYYSKALDYFYQAEQKYVAENNYMSLVNLYGHLGDVLVVYGRMGDVLFFTDKRSEACAYHDKSYLIYTQHIVGNPEYDLSLSNSSPEEVKYNINYRKKYAGCADL